MSAFHQTTTGLVSILVVLFQFRKLLRRKLVRERLIGQPSASGGHRIRSSSTESTRATNCRPGEVAETLKKNCCQIISLNLILVSEGNNTIPEKTVAVPPSLFDPLAEQSALLEGILKYTDYQVTVLCLTSPGNGPRSAPVSVKTAEDGSCHLHEI